MRSRWKTKRSTGEAAAEEMGVAENEAEDARRRR